MWSKFMSFSIKAIIRGLWRPSARLRCSQCLWREVLKELERRGEGFHEAGAFLLGTEHQGFRTVEGAVYYDQLDPNAYSTGVCVLHADAFANLWTACRMRGLTVVADIHSHPGVARQSPSDRTNPMIAQAGHVALIVPDYARAPVPCASLGIYEYQGNHEWIDHSGRRSSDFFHVNSRR
jgi:proteasome lid subunit RPN8/RPN11